MEYPRARIPTRGRQDILKTVKIRMVVRKGTQLEMRCMLEQAGRPHGAKDGRRQFKFESRTFH